MSTFIKVDALAVSKDENGRLFLYPALLSINSSSKEELGRITDILERNSIFNFYNTGKYAGYDNRLNAHFTFDDGSKTLDWFNALVRLIVRINISEKLNCKLVIRKQELINYDICDESDTVDRFKQRQVKALIDAYVHCVRRLLEKSGHKDILDCKTLGDIRNCSLLIRDKLYIASRLEV